MQMLKRITFAGLLALTPAAPALAASSGGNADGHDLPPRMEMGDADAGQGLATTCQACHGAGGVSQMATWPNLAGQHYRYLLSQLEMIQSRDRDVPTMYGQLDNLDHDQLMDLAAYFSAQDAVVRQARDDADQLALGQRIYMGGLADKGVPACSGCHGPAGRGNAAAGYPWLSGQQVDYTITTLKAYRDGSRYSGDKVGGTYAQIMYSVAQNLSDAEIEALANYVTGLH
jgi:cytochrome c553